MLIECINCNTTSQAEVLKEYSHRNPYDQTDGVKYSFLECPSCTEPVLMKAVLRVDILEGIHWGKAKRIFPVTKFNVDPAIPQAIRTALIESIECFEAGFYTPAVIMCRRTLDGFCRANGVPKNIKLDVGLLQLKEKGIINEQLHEWATLLRHKGNDAAHDIEITFDKVDAKDLLDFTIAILDFTYCFKEKFENFKKRQEVYSQKSLLS